MIKYQDKYYSQLGLKVALEAINNRNNEKINTKNFIIDKDANLILGNRKIFTDKDGSVILNWYGPNGSYTQVPMYKLIKVINGEAKDAGFNFKNKIIYLLILK